MSDEPKRFDSVIEMLTHDCHKYALENARLKAEVERLRASSFVTAVPVEEYEKLKAEVERLRKAGDVMEVSLQADFNGCPYEPMVIREVIHKWRSAKEGKQP